MFDFNRCKIDSIQVVSEIYGKKYYFRLKSEIRN
jgi:hypothetical protein